jgi:hypothetical protein
VKNSLTLLIKRTVSRLFITYQTHRYKTNGFDACCRDRTVTGPKGEEDIIEIIIFTEKYLYLIAQ